jgi:hypothetical protein
MRRFCLHFKRTNLNRLATRMGATSGGGFQPYQAVWRYTER